uniref:Uncharacterized protein n=1 Tax=Trichogramma kaykai TaxID=54128 RepID=A0ABD2XIA9_9HYME
MGNTPLHRAVFWENKKLAELLLRRGADPNAANEAGTTPLHIVSMGDQCYDLAEMLFEICDQRNLTLLVDARDNSGNTPLHLALKYSPLDKESAIKLLLSRDADPNSANKEGSTPLYIVCDNYYGDQEDDVANEFFEICSAQQWTIVVYARDKLGRTPLQLAVTNLRPRLVDVLLNRGADLAYFVFPTAARFAEGSGPERCNVQLGLVSGLLGCVERLGQAKYELVLDDVLAIMQFFADRGVYDRTADPRVYLHYGFDKEEDIMKKVRIQKDVTLHESTKAFDYASYLKLANWREWRNLPAEPVEVCTWHLCGIMCRGLFGRWAEYPFWELIHYRLPLECCRMIVDGLANQDLMNICLTIKGLSQNGP